MKPVAARSYRRCSDGVLARVPPLARHKQLCRQNVLWSAQRGGLPIAVTEVAEHVARCLETAVN